MSCDAGFVYSQDFYPETLSTRFDLVCDSEAKQRLLGTLTMTGLLIGSVVGGRSGDYLGRKTWDELDKDRSSRKTDSQ